MPTCSVSSCTNYSSKTKGTEIKYHTFPKIKEIADEWIRACNKRENIKLKNACICSIHFEADCYEIPMKFRMLQYSPKNYRFLKSDAIPTLFLERKSGKSSNVQYNTLSPKEEKNEVSQEHSNYVQYNALSPKEEKNEDSQEHSNLNYELINNTKSTSSSRELESLRETILCLEEKNRQLTKKLTEIECKYKREGNRYEDALKKVFTSGQIRKLLLQDSAKRKIHWSSEDIVSAISLRSVSTKAYRYLRARNYPLPALSTLRSYVSKMDFSPGILKSVLQLMKNKASDLTDMDKLCVITFDEVTISHKIDVDKKLQQVLGPYKTCQTVMIRGLIAKWKQPIYYMFDQDMVWDILFQIITELFHIKFIVVAINSDVSSTSIKLWDQLGIQFDGETKISHPSDSSLNVYVFADAPHLIKLVRNHLFDDGFTVDNKIIDIVCFKTLLNISTSELTFAHELTKQHIYPKGTMRQSVPLAVQVLSHSVAKAIRAVGKMGKMPENSNWKLASELVELFNDWFDLFNSQCIELENCSSKNAFGADIKEQTELLNKMTDFVKKMKVGDHKNLVQFQKGIIISNKSLIELYSYVKRKYNVPYILTARLNQDGLENLFSYIRGTEESKSYPSPLEFKHRLGSYILGKHLEEIFTENGASIESQEECLTSLNADYLSETPGQQKMKKAKLE